MIVGIVIGSPAGTWLGVYVTLFFGVFPFPLPGVRQESRPLCDRGGL